jgi:hypothetical protein
MYKNAATEALKILGFGLGVALLLMAIMGVVRLGGERHLPSQIVLLKDVVETNATSLTAYTPSNANLSGLIVQYEDIYQVQDVNAAATQVLWMQALDTSGIAVNAAAYDTIVRGIDANGAPAGIFTTTETGATSGCTLIEDFAASPLANCGTAANCKDRLSGTINFSNLADGPTAYGSESFRRGTDMAGANVWCSHDAAVSGGMGGVKLYFEYGDRFDGRVRLYGRMPE